MPSQFAYTFAHKLNCYRNLVEAYLNRYERPCLEEDGTYYHAVAAPDEAYDDMLRAFGLPTTGRGDMTLDQRHTLDRIVDAMHRTADLVLRYEDARTVLHFV